MPYYSGVAGLSESVGRCVPRSLTSINIHTLFQKTKFQVEFFEYFFYLVEVTGIEPIFSEPKSDVLPLDDTSIITLSQQLVLFLRELSDILGASPLASPGHILMELLCYNLHFPPVILCSLLLFFQGSVQASVGFVVCQKQYGCYQIRNCSCSVNRYLQ